MPFLIIAVFPPVENFVGHVILCISMDSTFSNGRINLLLNSA